MASKRQPIKYRDVLAMPGSELHGLLEDMEQASGKDKQELLMKVQKSYAETDSRYRKLMT